MKEKFLNQLKSVISINKRIKQRHIELSNVNSSTLFIGDIHGDTEVLQKVEKFLGRYIFIFLGDYVDRGNEGVEVLKTILSWKIELPDKVYMLRGNHEDISMNSYYGFINELMWKFKGNIKDILYTLSEFYHTLPIALFVDNHIIAVHGGAPIPPITRKELGELKVNSSHYTQLLWNDPCDEEYMPRGGGTRCFDIEDLKIFLKMVNAQVMIRAHQYINGKGIKTHANILYTVFSTRYGNPHARIGLLLLHPDRSIEKILL